MNDSEKLIACCNDIFEEMKKFYESHQQSCTGFNFSYSPKKSWKGMPKVLLLTIQPSGDGKPYVPPSPWPLGNDFFKRLDCKTFQKRLLSIPAEIARYKEGHPFEPSWKNKDLETFVDNNMVLASFIPFRRNSKNTRHWTKEEMAFAKERYWGRILELWQPEMIIAAGDTPADEIKDIFQKMSWTVTEKSIRDIMKFQLSRIIPFLDKFNLYICMGDKVMKPTYLLHVPNLAARGTTPFPRIIDPYPPNGAPIQIFLRSILEEYGLLSTNS